MPKKEDMIKISAGKVKTNDSDILRAGEAVIDPVVFSDMAKEVGSEKKLIGKLGKTDSRQKVKS